MSVLFIVIAILFSYTVQCSSVDVSKVVQGSVSRLSAKRTVVENNTVIVHCAANAIKEIAENFTRGLDTTTTGATPTGATTTGATTTGATPTGATTTGATPTGVSPTGATTTGATPTGATTTGATPTGATPTGATTTGATTIGATTTGATTTGATPTGATTTGATTTCATTTINSDTVGILNPIFQLFSNKCKDFTLAMSLKHQLQKYFFNPRAQNLKNLQISQLSLILIHLQTIANMLDDLQFRQNNSYCIRLSAHGYRMMYNALYRDNNSLLHHIKCEGEKWEGKYEKIDFFDCKVLHPTFIMTQN